jgi:glycosyltransferase involved in cell wall biosynthesis
MSKTKPPAKPKSSQSTHLRLGLVVPHIFMQDALLPRVIFSPAVLALSLSEELNHKRVEVTLYSPGAVSVPAGVHNVTADLSGFEAELAARGDDYLDLLKKHPLTFVTLARQIQGELIMRAYTDANAGRLDLVHVYTNEEELALVSAHLCQAPVVFTHHDPFNFLVRYRSLMPRYQHLNWISMSMAQRRGMPTDTNWVGNVYHGLPIGEWTGTDSLQGTTLQGARPHEKFVLYLGRIIESKGVHLAIAAVKEYNRHHLDQPLKLILAGKHYSGAKSQYWQERILPELGPNIEYIGFVDNRADKRTLLMNAQALLIPSLFDEPFGLVQLEALACGTPVVGLDSGAIGEVIHDGQTGFLVPSTGRTDEQRAQGLAEALGRVPEIDRRACRADFEARFTAERMAVEHLHIYSQLKAEEQSS